MLLDGKQENRREALGNHGHYANVCMYLNVLPTSIAYYYPIRSTSLGYLALARVY